jgi:hypothetical protein
MLPLVCAQTTGRCASNLLNSFACVCDVFPFICWGTLHDELFGFMCIHAYREVYTNTDCYMCMHTDCLVCMHTDHLVCMQGDKMKPELKEWVMQRLHILKALEA